MEYANLGEEFILRDCAGEGLITPAGCFTKVCNDAELRESYLEGSAVIYGTLEETTIVGICELEGFGLSLYVRPGGLLLVRGRLADATIYGGTVILERGSSATGITVGEHGRLIVQKGAKIMDISVRGGLLIKEP